MHEKLHEEGRITEVAFVSIELHSIQHARAASSVLLEDQQWQWSARLTLAILVRNALDMQAELDFCLSMA